MSSEEDIKEKMKNNDDSSVDIDEAPKKEEVKIQEKEISNPQEETENKNMHSIPKATKGFGNSNSNSTNTNTNSNSNSNFNQGNNSDIPFSSEFNKRHGNESNFSNQKRSFRNKSRYRDEENRNDQENSHFNVQGPGFGNRNRNPRNQNDPFANQKRQFDNNYYDMGYNDKYSKENEIIENKSINSETVLAIQKAFLNLSPKEAMHIFEIINSNISQTVFESMNEFAAENIIKHTEHKMNQQNFIPFSHKTIEIFEIPDLKFLNPNHEKILLYYKVYSNPEESKMDLPEEYYYKNQNERRRALKKNEDGIYNYIPEDCPLNHNQDDSAIDGCQYAHSENEKNYHSLRYKLKVCPNYKDCKEEYCPNAHNLEDDFRIIYDYRNENILSLMNYLKSNIQRVLDYLQFFKREIFKFSRKDFKTSPCPFGNNCNKDTHLCNYYHTESEKRRPEMLFRYSNIICEKALMAPNKGFIPSKCPYGDFCTKCHSKYEFQYHEKNFQKCIKCQRKRKKDGICIYFDTCYGKHDKEDEENEQNRIENEFREKYKKCKKKLNSFHCFHCKNVPKDFVYCLMKCEDILCFSCFKESVKKNGEKCIVCDKGILKKDISKIDFVEIQRKRKEKEEKEEKEENENEKEDEKEEKEDESDIDIQDA